MIIITTLWKVRQNWGKGRKGDTNIKKEELSVTYKINPPSNRNPSQQYETVSSKN